MPVMKNRPTKGAGKSAQVRQGGGQGGNGVQKFDGRANTNAGTSVPTVPKAASARATVIKTH